MKKQLLFLFIALIGFAAGLSAQTANIWTGSVSTSWAVAGNWSLGVVPTTAHNVTFNTGTTITVINVPTVTIAQLTVNSNTNVSLQAATTSTLSINGPTLTNNLSIAAGSTLQLGTTTGPVNLTIITTASQRGDISGTLILNSSSNVTTSTVTTTIVTVASGGVITHNSTGAITSTAATLSFAAGSTYNHARNGGAIPTATWNAASTCNVTGITTTNPTGLTGAFGNFTWNNTGQTSATGAISAAMTINGNLNIAAGTLLLPTFGITGNATGTMTIASGATLQIGNGATAVAFPSGFTGANISLNSSSNVIYGCTTAAQTVSGVPTYGNLTITGASVKTLGAATTVNGNLAVNTSGATLATGAFALTGNATGTLTLVAGANMTLGSGATAVAFPTNFLPANVSLAPTSTVTYSSTASQTIAPVNYGNLNAAGAAGARVYSGTIGVYTTFTPSTLSNTVTGSTIDFNGVAQNVPLLTGGYYNLRLSNSGLKTATGAATILNNLEIDGATTIYSDAGFTITGNGTGTWTMTNGATYRTTRAATPWLPLNFTSGNISFDANTTIDLASTAATTYSNTAFAQISNTFPNLAASGSLVKTLSNAITVTGNLTISGSTTLADGGFQINGGGTGTLNIANGATLTLGTPATATSLPSFATYTLGATSNVSYNSNQAQTISSVPAYGNLLTVATAAVTKTFDGNTTIQNIFTNGTNNTADFAGYTISVAGTTSCFANSGTINASNPSSKLLLNGVTTQTFSLGGTYTSPGIANLEVASNATFNGTPSVSSIINNLQINTGKTFSIATYALYLGGTYTNNGTLTANSGNATIHFVGTSAQTFNIGTYTGNIIGIASTSGGIVINNAAGVTLNAPLNVAGLTLTNGLLNTDATNIISVTSTTSGSVSAGTSTSYVNGPMQRSFLASSSTTGVWTFPIGKATLGQFEIINPTQGAGTNIVVRAEVFDTPAGGTDGTAFSATPGSNRYWQVEKVSGTSVFTSISAVEIIDDSYTVTASNVIGNSSTLTGTYNTLGGTLASEIISNSAVPPTLGYFIIGSAGCLNGTYTIGAAGDFTNLTSAVSVLNGSIVCSDLTFELRSDYTGTSGETFPISLNALTYGSGGPFNVTFRPQTGVTARVTSGIPVGTTTPLINFNGADFVTFDGRPGGTGTTSQWTLQNTQTTTPGSAVTFVNDAQNNTLQYLTLQSSSSSTTQGVVFIGDRGALGNDNISILNNIITRNGTVNPLTGIWSGSSTGSGLNDNIIIQNNSISEFTSNGILINASGNGNNWNISNNSFFRVTATTTPTVININSPSSSGYTIDGNKIGGSTINCGGSAWSSGLFTAITVNLSNTTVSTITNNIIQNISSTSNFTGITVSGSGNIDIGTPGNGNLIGHVTTAGSITFAGTTFNGIVNGASGTINIQDNTIANITQNTTTGVTVTAIQNGSTGSGVINNNAIYNLTSNSTTTTLGISGIIQTVTGATHSISNNTIYNLSKTGATGTPTITGINVVGSTTYRDVAANNIYNLTSASTTIATAIRGIYINAGNFNVYNNFVTLGNGITASYIIRGIDHSSTSSSQRANFYHNSIYIGGTVSSGTVATAAFSRSSSATPAATYLLNNILVNNRSGGTGRHAALFSVNTTNFATIANSNYNLYQATGTSGALVTYNNGTNYYTTITDITTNTVFDDNSISNDPQFIDPTNATTPNLHISLTNPTPIDGVGTAVTPDVTVDIDGDDRTDVATTPIDLGADAGAFIAVDQTAPTIVIGTVAQPCNTATSLTFTATITDGSAVRRGTGFRPRVYFKKSTDSNDLTSTGWVFAEATNSVSPFSFTINFSALADGGATAGNIIQYFVVAQDSGTTVFTPNVAISSGTFAATPTSVALTSGAFPIGGTPTTFVLSPCQGVISVGTGGDYPAFTTANGIFNAINGATLTGNLTINVVSDINIEDGLRPLNQWAESGVGGYTVTIQSSSAGTNRDIATTGTGFAGGLFRLDGADRVTFNGGTGTARDLTFRNTNTSTTAATFVFLNDASNNTIQNCIIEGANTSSTGAPTGTIWFSTTTGTTGNDNNLITRCDIRDLTTASATPNHAIFALGTTGKENSGNTISYCNIYNFYNSASVSNGVWVSSFNSAFTIDNNRLYQTVSRAHNSDMYAIQVAQGTTGTTTVSNNTIGYASSAGTGIFTFTGSGNSRFTAIQSNGGTTSITDNNIQGLAFSTNSGGTSTPCAFTGIYLAAGNSTITGNTIGSTTSTGAATNITLTSYTGTFSAVYGVRNISTGTVNISNNNMGNITLTHIGTTNGILFYGISATTGNNTISGNTIGSATLANSIQVTNASGSANPAAILGIVGTSGSGYTQTITNNTIANFNNLCVSSNANSPVPAGVGGISASGGGQYVINGNSIYNLSAATATSASGSSAAAYGIVLVTGNTQACSVSNNTIHSIAATNTGTTATQVIGISYNGGSSTSNAISNNIIHSLNNASTSATTPFGQIYGIQVALGSGVVNVNNNMVRLGIKDDGNPVDKHIAIVGLEDVATSNTSIYYNSIFVGGTVSTGATTANISSFAFRRVAASGTDIIKNNIFANDRTGGSGATSFHLAMSTNGVTGLTAANFDNNIYYSRDNEEFSINNAGAILAGTTGAIRLQNLRGQSIFNNNLRSGVATLSQIGFVNATGDAASVNLQLNNNNSASGAGVPIAGITLDALGTTRNTTTPSIGAHEASTFVPLSSNAAYDIYTPLYILPTTTNQVVCTTGVNTITVTITDLGMGLSTSANKPHLYIRKAAGSGAGTTWAVGQSVEGQFVSGTAQNSVWSFDIDYAALGITPANNDEYEYYVAAEDLATTPNDWYSTYTATTPIHTAPANFTVAQTAAYTLGTNRYLVLPGLSGTVTVGSPGGTYSSFMAPNSTGLFWSINNGVLTGDLTVRVISDVSDAGNWQSLNTISEGCGTGWKLKITPDGNTLRTISGTPSQSYFVFNNIDRLVIDGRDPANLAGNQRNLLFRNLSNHPTFWINGGCQDDSIRNVIVEGVVQTSSAGAALMVFGGPLATGGNISNIHIGHNLFRERTNTFAGYSKYSILSQHGSGTISDINIFNNDISNWSTFSGGSGIAAAMRMQAGTGNNWKITGNSFYTTFIEGTGAQNVIQLVPGTSSSGHLIDGNYIGGSAPLCGGTNFLRNNTANDLIVIDVNVGNATRTNITNNTIKRIESQVAEGGGVTTIWVRGSSRVNISDNAIGDATLVNSICGCGGQSLGTLNTNWVYGVYSQTSDSLIVHNNLIGGLASTGAFTSYGYSIIHSANGSTIISNNNIVNSYNGGNAVGYDYFGIIVNSNNSNHTITGNTLSKLGDASSGSVNGPLVCGIVVQGTNNSATIANNKITDLFHVGNGGESYGIYTSGTGNRVINNNQINMNNRSWLTTYTTRKIYYGIYDLMISGSTLKLYNNTVLVQGSQTGTSGFDYPSSCYYRFPNESFFGTGAAVDLKNNIFINSRTGNPTALSLHYAVDNTGTNAATGWTSNYNFISAPVAANLTYWNSADRDFAAWKTASGSDANSWSVLSATSSSNTQVNPADLFVDAANGDLNIAPGHVASWFVNGKGVAGTQVGNLNTDYAGNTRGTTYGYGIDIGANEFTPTVNPHTLTPSVAGAVSTFTFAGRTLGSVTWSASSPPSLEMKYFSGEGPGDSPSPTYPSVNKSDFMFEIEPTTSTSGFTYMVEMNYDDALLGSFVAAEATMKAIKSDPSTAWLDVDDGAINTTQNRLKSTPGLSTFSFWGGGEGTTPLPVELVDFNAECSGSDVVVSWTTATELNNDYFTVQRSTDLVNFVDIAIVEGAGNSNTLRNYSIKDENAIGGTVYYRLMQTDYNSQFEVFAPKAVNCKVEETEGVTIFPNPAKDVLTVNINLANDDRGTVTIFNAMGQQLSALAVQSTKGLNNYTFDISNLAAGQYFVSVQMGSKVLPVQKLVITK